MSTAKRLAMGLLAPVAALVAAMIITSLVIAVSGSSPGDFWGVIFSRPANRLIVNMVNQAALIYISATAAAIAFRMNLFNIGVEGQYTLASYAAATLAGAAIFPGPLNVLASLVLAVVVGAGWAGIAALLKVTRGVSEVISTIMLNAIAVTLAGYLLDRYGVHEGNGVRSKVIEPGSQLSGWHPFTEPDGAIWTLVPLAVVAGVAFWLLLNKTRFGFDLRATGASPTAAIASGVNVNRMVVVSMLISGGVAGLIWMPALFGSAHSYGTAFQGGLGFTGIAVALLGRNQPVGIVFGAVLFAFLAEQSNQLTFLTDISVNVVQITQGTIVLTVVIAYEVVRRYRIMLDQRAVAPPSSRSAEPEGAAV
ncbi:MAG: ABC transporter permease [Propionibacteriales bacterium]|nr:ABC transporter permease [Propionibacteriales bacterium]